MADNRFTAEELALLLGQPEGKRNRLEEQRQLGRMLREQGTLSGGTKSFGGFSAADNEMSLLGDLMSRWSGRRDERSATQGLEGLETGDVDRRKMLAARIMGMAGGPQSVPGIAGGSIPLPGNTGPPAPMGGPMGPPGPTAPPGMSPMGPPQMGGGGPSPDAAPPGPSPGQPPGPSPGQPPVTSPGPPPGAAPPVAPPPMMEAPPAFAPVPLGGMIDQNKIAAKNVADKQKLMALLGGLRNYGKKNSERLGIERELAQGDYNSNIARRGY